MPSVNLPFPVDLFERMQYGFESLLVNANSMESLSSHLGSVMQSLSSFGVSPGRRVIWYEEDLYPASEGESDDGFGSGLQPEEIDDIPVHEYNSRRAHTDSSRYRLF